LGKLFGKMLPELILLECCIVDNPFPIDCAVAAKYGKEVIAPFGYDGTCNSGLFLWRIKTMLVPKLKKRQIVIMDSASIHTKEGNSRGHRESRLSPCVLASVFAGSQSYRAFLELVKKKNSLT
jgi:hypothetical protein